MTDKTINEKIEDEKNDIDFDFNFEDQVLTNNDEQSSLDNTKKDLQTLEKEKKRQMALFNRIPVMMTLEVASVEISLAELMAINGDSVIELDKLAGEPLDIKVNGIIFGKAEVVVVNDKYGLRIIEFNNKELGELAL